MRMKFLAALAALPALAAGSAVSAQDINSTNTIGGDFAMLGMQNNTLQNALGSSGGSRRGGGGTRAPRGSYFAPVRPGARAGAFPFQSTASSRKQAADAYVARIARSDRAAAQEAAAQLARHDFSRIYGGIVAPFGYRANDAADGLAAYTLLGWLIATGSGDPTPRQAQAVRAQIAARAAGNPSFANPASRAKLGEEMKLLFVTLHSGWQSAKREGNLRQYADGVARLFQSNDIDLRALRLTDQGFAAR
jgi:hypothetical protein